MFDVCVCVCVCVCRCVCVCVCVCVFVCVCVCVVVCCVGGNIYKYLYGCVYIYVYKSKNYRFFYFYSIFLTFTIITLSPRSLLISAQELDLMYADIHDKLEKHVAEPLSSYLQRFPDIRVSGEGEWGRGGRICDVYHTLWLQ